MTTEGERLQKVLARAGVGSRRAVEDMIVRGRITVNGNLAVLGQRIDEAKDKVAVDGSSVPLDSTLRYFLMNKPVGVVSTAADDDGRETVVDLAGLDEHLWPVGRLDMDSEGALVLTNDGDLTLHLTHPRYEVPKTYLVEVRGGVRPRSLKALARGVELADGVTGQAQVRLVDRVGGHSLVEIAICEGRNRQVRRMMEALGHPVVRLVRTAIGPVQLGRLKPATVRRLAEDEVRALYAACGL